MPLPTPSLDDRHFQDIVDQAKRLIPQYCQEWTDHNVSDPGVTLIELFAWMTDMLLYRVNQVPDKNYIKFLEMIGMQLAEPRPATAHITFYLSAAQPVEVTIPADTEVATVRTETSQAITFTTNSYLTIRPPILLDALTRNISAARDGRNQWTQHDLKRMGQQGWRMPIFPPQPEPGDAFYLAFQKDHSQHILALILDCETASGAGVDPTKPPIVWEVWLGGAAQWVACEVEHDGTGGFNQSGQIILYVPDMKEDKVRGLDRKAYWLRCKLTNTTPESGAYKVSPIVKQLQVEARGGTVGASHAISIKNEILGTSDGTPGQTFKLLHTPILSLDPRRDYLVVEPPKGKEQPWEEKPDFGDSRETDYHFTLDHLEGTLTLGPWLLQPDGQVVGFGAVPEKGSILRFTRYQHGGGVEGNVAQGTLTVLKSSIPYVARVVNRVPAVGGQNAQSLEDAKLRAPQKLRTRTRAVTADDYEYLACQQSGVARSCCLAPGAQPGAPDDPRPGQIFVIALPQTDATEGRISPDRLTLSAETRSAVLKHLNESRLLGTGLDVQAPKYTWVSVQATLHVPEGSEPALRDDVKQHAEDALYRYLNPYIGGPRGDGWPFGRALNRSELYGLLQGIEHVEYVEEVLMSVSESAGGSRSFAAVRTVPIARSGLICSDIHQVKVN